MNNKGGFLGTVIKNLQQEQTFNQKSIFHLIIPDNGRENVQLNLLDSFSRNKSVSMYGKDNPTNCTHNEQSYFSNIHVPQKDNSVEISFDAKPNLLYNNRQRLKLKEICKKLTLLKQDCALKLSQVELEGVKLKESKISIYNLLTREIDNTLKKDEEMVRQSQIKIKRLIDNNQSAQLEIESLYESCLQISQEEVDSAQLMIDELERQICSVRNINIDLISQNFKIISNKEYQCAILQIQEMKQRELQELNLNQSLIFQNEQKISNALSVQLDQNRAYLDELKDQIRKLEEKLSLEQRTIQHLQDKLLIKHAKNDEDDVKLLQNKIENYQQTLYNILNDNSTYFSFENDVAFKDRVFDRLKEILKSNTDKINELIKQNSLLMEEGHKLNNKNSLLIEESHLMNNQMQQSKFEILNLNQAKVQFTNLINEIQAQNKHLQEINDSQFNQINYQEQFKNQQQKEDALQQQYALLQQKERQDLADHQISNSKQDSDYWKQSFMKLERDNDSKQQTFVKLEKDLSKNQELYENQLHNFNQSEQHVRELDQYILKQKQEFENRLKNKDMELLETQDQMKNRQLIFNDKLLELNQMQQFHVDNISDQYQKQFDLLTQQFDHEVQRLQMELLSHRNRDKEQQDFSMSISQLPSYSTNSRPPKVIINQVLQIKSPAQSPSEASLQSGSFYNEVSKFQKVLDDLSQDNNSASTLRPGFMRKRQSSNIFIEDRSNKTMDNDSDLTLNQNQSDISPFQQTFNLNNNRQHETLSLKESSIQSEAQNEDIFPPYDHRICLRCKRNDMVAPNFCKYQEVHSIKDIRESTIKPKKTWQVNKNHVYGTNLGWRQKEDSYSSIKQQSSYMSNKSNKSEKFERGINTILQLVNDQNCQKFKKNTSQDRKYRKDKQRNSSVESVSSSSKLNISVNF